MPKNHTIIHYPLFVDLRGAPVLVVGAGRVAERKIRGLLTSGARISVVAPLATQSIRNWAADRKLVWARREVRLADLRDRRFVFCATDHPDVDRTIARAARRRGLLANCASAPEIGDVILPAVARQGRVQIAVSTGGASPVLARKLATRCAAALAPNADRWARLLEQLRPLVLAKVPGARRAMVWKHLTADKLGVMVSAGRMSEARKYSLRIIDQFSRPKYPPAPARKSKR